MWSELFKQSTDGSAITLKRVIVPRFVGVVLLISIPFLLLALLTVLVSYAMHMDSFLHANAAIAGTVATLDIALLIKWNYFSRHPASVRISPGEIILRFRKLLTSDEVIQINPEHFPILFADCQTLAGMTILTRHYYARVRIESTNLSSTVIHLKKKLTEELALSEARRFAADISGRTGFSIGTQ